MSGKRPTHPPQRFNPTPPKSTSRTGTRGRPRKKIPEAEDVHKEEENEEEQEEMPLSTQLPSPPRPDPPAHATQTTLPRTPPRTPGVPPHPRTPGTTTKLRNDESNHAPNTPATLLSPVKEEEKGGLVHSADVILNRYYYDIIDLEQHCILFDRTSRTERWHILQHFWSSYPNKEKDYGRLFVRTRFCSLLVDACSEPGYSETSLVAWETKDWHDFIDDLALTKGDCLRSDCQAVFGLGQSELPPSTNATAEESNTERAQLVAFTNKYTVIEKACQVNLHLAPIRGSLEQQIQSGATGPPVDIAPELLQTLFAAAQNSDSFVVKRYLLRLFVSDAAAAASEEAQNHQPILRNLEELKDLLGAKPFSLLWFQNRLEQLVWLWNEACFGTQQPYLRLISYHENDRRESGTPRSRRASPGGPTTPSRPAADAGNTEVLATLKRRREALRQNHGDDPLSESRRIAKVLKKSMLHDGKKSKLMVAFEDSDEEIGGGGTDGTNAAPSEGDPAPHVRLSSLPERPRASPRGGEDAPVAVGSKMYTGPPPDEGIFDPAGNVLRRHPWTEEEGAALLSGFEKYGFGKWVQIKQEYGYILRNRTTVQIKDKFRNMQRRGEVPDAV